MKTELIDRIYECAVVPELWPDVLDGLAELTDSRGGLLFSARDRVLQWTASANLNDIFRSYVEDGWFTKCPRRVCLFGRSLPAFFVEQDFWTPDQLDSNPIYRDFFRPHGLGWSAGTGLQLPTGDHIVFSIEREHSRGPIEKERVERVERASFASGAQRVRCCAARAAARQGRQGGADVDGIAGAAARPGRDSDRSQFPDRESRRSCAMARAKPHRADRRPRQRTAVVGACGARHPFRIRGALVSAARRRRQGGDGGASHSDPPLRPRYFRGQLRAAGADAGGGPDRAADRTDAIAVRPDPVGSKGGARPCRRRDSGRDRRKWRRGHHRPCARNCVRCWKKPDAPARPKSCRCWPMSRSIAARRRTSVWPLPISAAFIYLDDAVPVGRPHGRRDHSRHRPPASGGRQLPPEGKAT